MKWDLKGARILVTRPCHQAENLCSLIEENGGVAVRFPTLQIVGNDSLTMRVTADTGKELNGRFPLSPYQWLVFTSVNAVNFALKANSGKIDDFKAAKIAAIGDATARELAALGIPAHCIAKQGFNSESLLAMPQMQGVKGLDILIIRGQGGREELASVLKSRGANVDYWEVYRRVIPAISNFSVITLLQEDLLDMITITSGEALQNLLTMLGQQYKNKLAAIQLLVISDRISRLAVEMGFTRVAVAENPSDSAIIKVALALTNGENSG